MKKVTAHLILFTLLFLLTSQVAHAERDREIMRLGRGQATSLDWRPDGKVLAVGSTTGVWFFNENLDPIGHLDIAGASQIVWDSSGEKLAIVNADANKMLQVWQISKDTADQKQIWIQSWTDSDWSPIEVAWEPNGQRLVTGREKDFARIWDAVNGNLITTLAAKGSYVAWSPDGTIIAVGGDSVNIINASSLKIVKSISQFSASGKINWNSDGTLLATNCNDTEKFTDFDGECIWDTKTYKLVYSQELARIAWSSNASEFAFFGTSGFESDVTWFEVHNSLSTEAAHNTSISLFFVDLKWQPNKDIVTALAGDGTLITYNVNTEKFTSTLTLFTNSPEKLIWSPDNRFLVSTQNNTQQIIWELSQSQKLVPDALRNLDRRIGTYGPRQANIIWQNQTAFWSIGEASDWNGHVAIFADQYDVKTGENLGTLAPIYTNCWFYFNSNMSQAACPQPDKKVLEIWNIPSQSVASTIPVEKAEQIYWSPDDSMIATVSSNDDEMSETLEIWQVKNSKRISEYTTYGTAITNLSWSPNSQAFAARFSTAGMNGMHNSIHVFQVADENQNQVIDLSDVSEALTTLQWSSDNQKLLVATYKTISLYKANDLSKITSLKIPPTRTVSLSPDDKLLALGMDDGTIRIWDVSDLMAN